MDPKLNKEAIALGEARNESLSQIIADPNLSPKAKADATAARTLVQKEVALRKKVDTAKTPAEKKKAESDLAAFRTKNCPKAGDGELVTKCRPPVIFVHLHMRFLLSHQFLKDLQDSSKYPRRAKNVSAETFKARFSFEGQAISTKTRWAGSHPVVGATVTLAGQKAVTDSAGTARFENVESGTYTLGIEPPPNQSTTMPAGPELPVASGYSYKDAPSFMYRPFQVTATIDETGQWQQKPAATVTSAGFAGIWELLSQWQQKPAATVTLPYQGDGPAYAGVVGSTAMDLYLDWKPDWLKVPNRKVVADRTNQAIVMHQTVTYLHEQIGSPIATFSDGSSFGAHYLVDLDGHVVKTVHESERTSHAAASHWHELDGLNESGIGIETVHTDYDSKADFEAGRRKYREFPDEQYSGINRLVNKLRSTFDIEKHYVCGHNDCRNEARECPGDMFDWKKLEDADNALKTHTSGVFAGNREVKPNLETAEDEAVPMSKRLYDIGYTGKTVSVAVERFLRRAWSGSRFNDRPKGTGLEVVAAPRPGALLGPVGAAAGVGAAAAAAAAAAAHDAIGANAHPAVPPKKPQPPKHLVTQPVADALDQMFRDL